MIWVLTSPGHIPDEAAYLNALAAAGPVTLLVRKPGWPLAAYASLLRQLHHPARVVVADHPQLLAQFPVAGFHMSERLRATCGHSPATLLPGTAGTTPARQGPAPFLTTSIHQPASPGPEWRYLLLGPVFDSLSKPGYTARGHLFHRVPANAIAIGGVQAGNITAIKKMGFCGAALLGAIWQQPANAVRTYLQIQALWEHSS